MSFSMRLPARLIAVRPAPVARVYARAMSSGSAVHGQDPKTLETEKKRNLKGEQDSSNPHPEHAPGWNEKLASDSEAAVKADQAAPSGGPTKAMQDQTVKKTHDHHGQ
ncbi:uncharacterized protein MKK02DRAFT_42781 [Dioszegia hungarica]|uniref:Uncharacterized protein n=1 Tax=Dioszegia hungarica TaxID=4972 RepID=A0AA38HBQ6_9TREE|nr:uncharacterized protein MKK02DRAFT_42781 [Dioszegia hungarica]KAI9638393.1 hypothetical protein MKK02DRAFT_42781 [Dioszegia hungarica]